MRELTLDDLDFVAGMLAHPEVMAFWPRCYSREEAVDWIHRQQARYAGQGHGYWLIVEKAAGEPVGQAGLLTLEVEGETMVSLRYLLHRPFWHRGFATEAAAACRDYAFETLGLLRLIALIRPENLSSQAVARRLGMTPEKSVPYYGFEYRIFALARNSLT